MRCKPSHRAWSGLVAALAVLVIATGVFLARRSPPHRPVEVARDRLVLKDGRMLLKPELQPFSGLMVETYPSGALKSRSALVDGHLSGLSEGFYTNGQVQVRKYFKAGVSHGLRTKYYEDGTRLSEANIQDGRISGVFRRWHENGKLAEEIAMSNGIPEGVARAYYASGFLKAELTHAQGKVVRQKAWKEEEGVLFASASATDVKQ